MLTYAKSIAWVSRLVQKRFGVEVLPYICEGYVGIKLPSLTESEYSSISEAIREHIALLPVGFVVIRNKLKVKV